MYNCLDKLGERVLYYDTDSVVFTQKPNEIGLELGDLLGELTDELSEYGDGSYINEAVISSEKSYAYRVVAPDGSRHSVCKVKGITLNYKNSEEINFETLKRMVLTSHRSPDDVVKLKDRVILRTYDSYVYTTDKEYTLIAQS